MDPIADFLTTIRNGVMVAKPFVVVNYSKMKNAIGDSWLAGGIATENEQRQRIFDTS